MALSKKRKALLIKDRDIVDVLYKKAIEQWGRNEVEVDLTKLWDLRCMWGMHGVLPFGATEFKNLGEMLYIATELCGYGKSEN